MPSLYVIFRTISIFIRIIYYAILVFTVMSWFRPRNNFYMMLGRFVAPFIMPFRRLSMWIASKIRLPIDFSCWFAIIALSIVNQLWWRLYFLLRNLIF